jgi:quercetin dioxygenase-like cupin family protein
MKILPKHGTNLGSEDNFTGKVELTPLKLSSEDSTLIISRVSFPARARSAWHSHPKGQTLYVIEGIGLIQKRGEPIQIIKTGDVIWTGPNEEHWHGASMNQPMTHLAIQDADERGNFISWGKHVTDEEYSQQPED